MYAAVYAAVGAVYAAVGAIAGEWSRDNMLAKSLAKASAREVPRTAGLYYCFLEQRTARLRGSAMPVYAAEGAVAGERSRDKALAKSLAKASAREIAETLLHRGGVRPVSN